MIINKLVLNLITFIFSIFFFRTYIYIWKKLNKNIPKGCGIILPICFSFATYNQLSTPFLIITCLVTMIYWIDDLIELSAKTRIFLSAFSGAMILIFNLNLEINFLLLLLLFIVFGFICTGLTNVINFYDGNDLNISFLLFLTGGIYTFRTYPEISDIGIIFLILSITFSIFNKTPKNLYWGDSGCFSLAYIFTIFLVLLFFNKLSIPSEVFIPLFLPIFDVFFVILIRLKRRHNLLSRNYLHLYQRIAHRYGKKYYLLPQLVNVIFVLLVSIILNNLGINNLFSPFISGFFITPINYFILRKLFVEKEFLFSDGDRK